VGGINHIDCINLPSKRAIEALCADLLRLLFPGFHDEEPIHSEDLEAITERRIFDLVERFGPEVAKSLKYSEDRGGRHEENAEELVRSFLSQLPDIRELLRADVEAAYEGDPAAFSVEEIIVSYPGIEAMAVQRMAHLLFAEGVPLLPRMMSEWAHSRTGIDIHPGATIGSHFFVDHGTGVVVGQTAVIGKHVRLYQGVTLGALSVSEHVKRDPSGQPSLSQRHPTIEDGVTIYAGATILGGKTVIGARSVIGGNVWITESIPPDTVVTVEAQQQTIRPRARSELRI
jgi:serine O-acetyltransferase